MVNPKVAALKKLSKEMGKLLSKNVKDYKSASLEVELEPDEDEEEEES